MSLLNLFRQTLAPEVPEVQYDVRQQSESSELTRLRTKIENLQSDKLAAEEAASATDNVARMYRDRFEHADAALVAIIAMETPSSAHIGKKMAARAKAGRATPVIRIEPASPPKRVGTIISDY